MEDYLPFAEKAQKNKQRTNCWSIRLTFSVIALWSHGSCYAYIFVVNEVGKWYNHIVNRSGLMKLIRQKKIANMGRFKDEKTN